MTQKEHPQFRTKAQREQDRDLQSKYRDLGNPELIEAIKQQKKSPPRHSQMQMEASKREHD